MDSRQETQRLLQWLRLLVKLSVHTQGEIEHRAALSSGYLSQILGGRVDINLRHLLAILQAIDMEPPEFFCQLFPRRRQRTAEILRGLQRHPQRVEKPLIMDLARLYAFGIESIEDLEERLDRCEDVIGDLASSGILR